MYDNLKKKYIQIYRKYKIILGIIFIFGFLVNIPFMSQAFHIDDPLNIYLARQILKDPTNPYDFTLVYNGRLQKFYQFYANPPLGGYILSLIVHFFKESEVPLHFCYSIFTILIGFFMFLISKKFLENDSDAVLSTILLLISPAFFVMCHTIMPDIPLLCFYLAAIYFFLQAKEKNKYYFYIISGVFAGLSCLTRYSGITLIPIFLFCSFLREKNKNPLCILAILIPLVTFYFWYKWSMSLYSHNYWKNMFSFEIGQNKTFRILMHLIANISYLGGTTVFPLSLLCIFKKPSKKKNTVLIFIVGLISLYLAKLLYDNYNHSFMQSMLFFTFNFCFVSFLVVSFRCLNPWFIHKNKNILLFFWMILLIGFNSLFLHTAVKYNVLIIPPFILIFIILVKKSLPKKYFSFLIITIALTLVISWSVAIGDMKFANCYKDFAKKLYAIYKTGNNQIYYVGHWGWEYYMEKNGAKPMLSNGMNMISKGDVIFIPSIPWPQPLPFNIRNKILLYQKILINSRFPIRTMNGFAKAFFYANYNFPNYQGVLPYSFSITIPLEIFYIFKIE